MVNWFTITKINEEIIFQSTPDECLIYARNANKIKQNTKRHFRSNVFDRHESFIHFKVHILNLLSTDRRLIDELTRKADARINRKMTKEARIK